MYICNVALMYTLHYCSSRSTRQAYCPMPPLHCEQTGWSSHRLTERCRRPWAPNQLYEKTDSLANEMPTLIRHRGFQEICFLASGSIVRTVGVA